MPELDKIIAPPFYDLYYDVTEHKHTHYWLKGGRGSTKSTFVSVMVILGIMQNENANAVVIRKVGLYLKDSVFSQLEWAIEKLGVVGLWQCKTSPMEMIYIPTGQKILFRGADKPRKLKSTKVAKGYVAYIWYEECDEFEGTEEIRTINQSLMRGGEVFTVFYSYNPPKSQRSWVNKEIAEERKDRIVHHSTYLEVPEEWLGEQFRVEAEHLKKTKPDAYAHEYLGKVTGTGGEVFTNVYIENLQNELTNTFDKLYYGVDFGYAADPFVFVKCYFDKTRKTLYVFDEIYKAGLSNERAAELIAGKIDSRDVITADSAEPKSIAEMRRYGLNMRGAKKGRDSVEYGIKFLQSLDRIVIDGTHCPKAKEEFLSYELEPDGNDGFKDGYPDKNNHTIDAVRYALESEMSNRQARILNRKDFGL